MILELYGKLLGPNSILKYVQVKVNLGILFIKICPFYVISLIKSPTSFVPIVQIVRSVSKNLIGLEY